MVKLASVSEAHSYTCHETKETRSWHIIQHRHWENRARYKKKPNGKLVTHSINVN